MLGVATQQLRWPSRPDHLFGGSGAVPGAHTVVVDRMPAT